MNAIKEFFYDIAYGNGITTAIRILLGILFIYSGIFKVIDPQNFGRIIIMYNIIPEILVPYAALIFPFLELLLGILLFFGFRIKAASFMNILLMLFFIVIISINVVRGVTFECGCFELSRFGIKEEIGIPLVIRDIVFLAFLLLIFFAKRHYLSVDNFIEKEEISHI